MPTPEPEELEEGGYTERARLQLMRSTTEQEQEALAFLERQAQELGRRVITEREQAQLADLAIRLERLKQREAKIEELKRILPEIVRHAEVREIIRTARLEPLDLKKVLGERCTPSKIGFSCRKITALS